MQCQVTNTHSKYVHTYVHTYGVTPVVHGGGHGYLQGLPEQPNRLHGSCFQPPSLRSCKPQGLISARRTNSLMPSHAHDTTGLAARLAASRLQQPEGGIPQVSRADCVCSKCAPPHTTVRMWGCIVHCVVQSKQQGEPHILSVYLQWGSH